MQVNASDNKYISGKNTLTLMGLKNWEERSEMRKWLRLDVSYREVVSL